MGLFKSKKPKISEPKDAEKEKKTAKLSEKKAGEPYASPKPAAKAIMGQKHSALKAGKYFQILKKPYITEKSATLVAENKYIFSVPLSTNKTEVKAAVYAIFDIKPLDVTMVRTKGKVVRMGKISGKRTDFKKAIVTLPKGKKLDIYEGV